MDVTDAPLHRWPEIAVTIAGEFPWPSWWPSRWRHQGFASWYEDVSGASGAELRTATIVAADRRRELRFRSGTSDRRVIRQIFLDHDYDLRRCTRYTEIAEYLSRQRRRGLRPLIVDVGAHIGVSSLYFSLVLNSAVVVAIEPEPGNFALLQRNVAGLDVHCLQAALAASEGKARIVDPGEGTWGFRTERHSEGDVPAVPLDTIYRQFLRDDLLPFMVKIDVEGAEEDVFSANNGWITQTPLLVIELHDWLLPGRGTARNFLRAIADTDRDFVPLGENILSIRHKL
jgi:FkbM family methyltransferase